MPQAQNAVQHFIELWKSDERSYEKTNASLTVRQLPCSVMPSSCRKTKTVLKLSNWILI